MRFHLYISLSTANVQCVRMFFFRFIRFWANYSYFLLSCGRCAEDRARRPVRSGVVARLRRKIILSSAVYLYVLYLYVRCSTCYSTRRRSKSVPYMQRPSSSPFAFVFVFFSIYLFVFFFCLYVDSPRRSGGPPAASPLLIYGCVLHTETLSSVHWRLKYTRKKYCFSCPHW